MTPYDIIQSYNKERQVESMEIIEPNNTTFVFNAQERVELQNTIQMLKAISSTMLYKESFVGYIDDDIEAIISDLENISGDIERANGKVACEYED